MLQQSHHLSTLKLLLSAILQIADCWPLLLVAQSSIWEVLQKVASRWFTMHETKLKWTSIAIAA